MLLLQLDSTQAAGSNSTETGTLFWTIVAGVAFMAFLVYWLLKPADSKDQPAPTIEHKTAYPEDGLEQVLTHDRAVAKAKEVTKKNTTKNALNMRPGMDGGTGKELPREPSPLKNEKAAAKSQAEALPVSDSTPSKPVIELPKVSGLANEPSLPKAAVEPTVPEALKASKPTRQADELEALEKRLGIISKPSGTAQPRTPKAPSEATTKQATGNGQSGVGKAIVSPVPEDEKVSSTVKFIGYRPFAVLDSGTFPRVLMPEAGCVIKFPRVGRSGRRGFKEADFMEAASSLLSSGPVKVYNNRHVPTPNAQSPYEPDLVILNEENGLNLFLNIEIDEPYDGVFRQPIHCQGEDDARDEFFTRRGWLVVRFAEIQVHQQPEACCAYVAGIIAKLSPGYHIPEVLRGQVLQPVDYWDNVQAQKWAKANYREKYLGITGFGRREEQAGGLQATALAVEEEVERLVGKTATLLQPTRSATGRLEKLNPHPRDSRLQFDPEAHQYLIEGQPATAVSTLVDRFFPEFDKHYHAPRTALKRGMTTEAVLAEWDLKGKTSAALGTQMHEHIENFYDTGNTSVNLPEFKQFLNFHGDHGHLTPHRTEWRVFNEDLMIAGTLDFVVLHADGSVSIYDWKRSEKVIYANGQIQQNSYQTQEGPLGDLDDSRFSRYSIQQNLYKWLLESKYGHRVRSMHLVVLHPSYVSYTVIDVPDRSQHVQRIVESLQSKA